MIDLNTKEMTTHACLTQSTADYDYYTIASNHRTKVAYKADSYITKHLKVT